MQMVFQDPQASLNPRMTVASIIGEPLVEHSKLSKAEQREHIYELLDQVGLNRNFANRYPHEFSGGQRQRIGIARALALHPKFIVCVTSPLRHWMCRFRRKSSTCWKVAAAPGPDLFVHQPRFIDGAPHCQPRGRDVFGAHCGLATRDALYEDPKHPYSRALLSAVPEPIHRPRAQRQRCAARRRTVARPPQGCAFNTRCPQVLNRATTAPLPCEVKPSRFVACHLFPKRHHNGCTPSASLKAFTNHPVLERRSLENPLFPHCFGRAGGAVPIGLGPTWLQRPCQRDLLAGTVDSEPPLRWHQDLEALFADSGPLIKFNERARWWWPTW